MNVVPSEHVDFKNTEIAYTESGKEMNDLGPLFYYGISAFGVVCYLLWERCSGPCIVCKRVALRQVLPSHQRTGGTVRDLLSKPHRSG